MAISFDSPFYLILFVPAFLLIFFWWKKQTRVKGNKRWLIAGLRTFFFLLLICSIAGMNLLFPVQGETVVFVVDQSASMKQDSRILPFIKESVGRKKEKDRHAIISVGAEAQIEQPLTGKKEVTPFGSIVNPHATNIAEGIRMAAALIPNQARGKIILLTDGLETNGNALAEIRLAQERGLRVEAMYLAQDVGDEVFISSIQLPNRMMVGDEFQVKLDIHSTLATEGVLDFYEGNQKVGEIPIQIAPGSNRYVFQQEAQKEGFNRFRVELKTSQDTISLNNQAFAFSQVVGSPSVLVIEGTEGAGGNVVRALEASNIRVEVRPPALVPKQLEDFKNYQSIILANLDSTQIKVSDMNRIRDAVHDLGVGLVMTGGENSFGLGGWFQTPIEEALPVTMDLRAKEEIPSLALALVIDKSGSMAPYAGEVDKMALAREGALRATDLLQPKDQVAVVAFDGFPWVVVERQSAENIKEIQEKINGIQADGGTEIFTALYEGYNQIKDANTKRKHIILLTDGVSNTNLDYGGLLQEITGENITVSTVAIGNDSDTFLLQYIAEMGQGRYYFSNDANSIPQIFSKETALASRSFIVDKPQVPSKSFISDWTVLRQAIPELNAYVATSPKQTAETSLFSMDDDPILTRWQYGLGRSVAWTSDLEGKWTPDWVGWSEYNRLWNQIVTWTFPQVEEGRWNVQTEVEGIKGKVIVNLPVGHPLPQQMEAVILQEKQDNKRIVLKPVAPGRLEGEFLASESGTYLVQVMEKEGEQVVATHTKGLAVAYSSEYRLFEGGEAALKAWLKKETVLY